ncbi:UNVERIFIED_CONTAM: hypothetical protein K2H54_044133 [Gekko kuhli]
MTRLRTTWPCRQAMAVVRKLGTASEIRCCQIMEMELPLSKRARLHSRLRLACQVGSHGEGPLSPGPLGHLHHMLKCLQESLDLVVRAEFRQDSPRAVAEWCREWAGRPPAALGCQHLLQVLHQCRLRGLLLLGHITDQLCLVLR